jgi:hypothetical protein
LPRGGRCPSRSDGLSKGGRGCDAAGLVALSGPAQAQDQSLIEKMILNSGGGAWMVEGSPVRMMRDYNELVASYNRGARF